MLGTADDRGNPAIVLLKHVLSERVIQDIDLALLALQRVLDRETVGAIRAALKSGDKRECANACEALSNLGADAVTRSLSALLRGEDDDARTSTVTPQFEDLDTVLTWCAARQDVWLSHCAERALPLRRLSLGHG